MKLPNIGTKYADWTVISHSTEKYRRWYKYHVQCKCGDIHYILGSGLKSGSSTCCKKCKADKFYKGYNSISSTFLSRVKHSAGIRGIDFDISIQYLWKLFKLQDSKCALSGISIVINRSGSTKKSTASLDRIDSSKGYVEGNLQWVHKDINMMKNDLDQGYFVNMCKAIAENNK